MEKTIKEVMQAEPSHQKILQPTESFSEIELTEEEQQAVIEKALKEAKKKKNADIRTREYWNRVNNPNTAPKYNAQQTFALFISKVKEVNKSFVTTPYNEYIIKLLCLYFSQDPEFEKSGYSLSKGIILVGPVGCGKTTIMQAFSVNTTNSYAMSVCRRISNEYTSSKDAKDKILNKYSNLMAAYPQQNFGQSQIGHCFDDLGTESVKNDYGNQIDVMAEIIYSRYENGLAGKTHFTANLTSDQIGETYGERLRSRLREMCNLIEFNPQAEDHRK